MTNGDEAQRLAAEQRARVLIDTELATAAGAVLYQRRKIAA